MSEPKRQVSRFKHAALYVRMSTEHQNYSIANQTAALEKYARENAMLVTSRFIDPGKSGLTLAGRKGLTALLLAVISARADFEHVLVYDVSRWGRFLDIDESAYYEYTCKKANIKVHYCAEPFVNDGSPYSDLIKNLKRVMAGEYSRELSVKVHAAQTRLAQLGFRQGGTAGYGLRRQVVDRHGNKRSLLEPGDRKGFQSDRVLLAPGPLKEREMITQIFRWFVIDGFGESQIARLLMERKVKPESAGASRYRHEWTESRVHQILSNPKYVGLVVYNRTSSKLHTKRVRNPQSEWVSRTGAFEPIVDPELFRAAQQIISARLVTLTDYEVLDRLIALFRREGRLSTAIIK